MQRKQPWFVGVALTALGSNLRNTTREFTESELAGWAPDFTKTPGNAGLALERLIRHELVQQVGVPQDKAPRSPIRIKRYVLTPRGLATCRAAAQATHEAAPPDPAALTTRLWNLLRMRRKLTSDEAASLLVDAGSDEVMESTRHTLAGYLKTWAQVAPEVVQVSARRVGGFKAYVLLKDTGIHPPRTKASKIPHAAAPAACTPPADARRKVVTE